MTLHTFGTTTLTDSRPPGDATVMEAHVTVAINLGSTANVTVSFSPAPAPSAHGNGEPSLARIGPETGAHDTAQIDDLVSDTDEFTSVPSTTAAVPVTGDPGPPAVQANGTGNGHTTLVG